MHAKVSPIIDTDPSQDPASALDTLRQTTRPIRALSRGLEVLAELNRHDRAAIHTLAHAVRLPRTTTFRILETLRLAGFVERDTQDDCYRPTIKVRSLADGFDDGAMAAYLARQRLSRLATELVWPLDVATRVGSQMVVRETSQSPFALEARGSEAAPLLTSAAGRALLAFSPTAERDALLAQLAESAGAEDPLDRAEIERLLQETRGQGFGVSQRSRRVSEETTLAVPIRRADRVLATLAVRFAATAVPLRTAIEQFLPKMREFVASIEAELALKPG